MALSTATYTKSPSIGIDVTERKVTYTGTVAISASPGTYATGGLTLSLASGTLQRGVPDYVEIYSLTGSGWQYAYVPGTTIKDGKIKVLGAPADSGATTTTTALAELDAAATPAGVSGDTIRVRFTLTKGK